jgi:hypothetical protein
MKNPNFGMIEKTQLQEKTKAEIQQGTKTEW